MKPKKVSGIYEIKNKINGKRYIGSSYNIRSRLKSHFRNLSNNDHHNYRLQNDYNKYGKHVFTSHVICNCDTELLLFIEQLYLSSMYPEYNISLSSSSPMLGRKHSLKTISKFKNRKVWNKGIPRTIEERKYISERRKAKHDSLSVDEKLKNRERNAYFLKKYKPFSNKSHTVKNKKKLRKARIANRKKIKCIQTGKIYEAQIDISRDLNIRQGHVSEHLQGKRRSVKGYTFEYICETNPDYILEDDFRFREVKD